MIAYFKSSLTLAFAICAFAGPALAAKPVAGKPAPDFHVTTLDGPARAP